MNSNSLEIERRFLILRPPEPELAARCSHVYHMEQTYLLSNREQCAAQQAGACVMLA